MNEEKTQILAMLESGKITPEQADELMQVIEDSSEEPVETVELPSTQVNTQEIEYAFHTSPKQKKKTFGSKSGFTAQEILEMGIHGINPKFMKEMRQELGELSFNQLRELSIHDVSADFIKEVKKLSLDNLDFNHILEMGIHGVDAKFVKELQDLNIPDLSVKEMIEFAIHGIDTDFIRQVNSLDEKPNGTTLG